MTGLAKKWILESLEGLGRGTILCKEIACSLWNHPVTWRDVIYQIYFIGVKSQSVVLITGAFTGMVLCAQTYFQFHKVKMDSATLAVVSVSMGAELGPVLTGLMVAGRVGAAIAAELGTMRVTEQIDALRTLASHPVDYLVVPRFLGLLISLPLLTAEAVVVGISSAYLLGVTLLNIDPAYLLEHMYRYTGTGDMISGLIKSFFFGAFISIIACYKGLNSPQGAEGVGHATTEAVVYSSITILMSNFFFTLALNRIFH